MPTKYDQWKNITPETPHSKDFNVFTSMSWNRNRFNTFCGKGSSSGYHLKEYEKHKKLGQLEGQKAVAQNKNKNYIHYGPLETQTMDNAMYPQAICWGIKCLYIFELIFPGISHDTQDMIQYVSQYMNKQQYIEWS